VLGRAKLALCFQIPSQASLHGILKSIAHFAAQIALRLHLLRNLSEKTPGCSWPLQAGMFCEKASASPLQAVLGGGELMGD
jgi:hypothetical protein